VVSALLSACGGILTHALKAVQAASAGAR